MFREYFYSEQVEQAMKYKLIYHTVIFFMIFGFTARQDQVIANELQKGHLKTYYSDIRFTPKAPPNSYVNYKQGAIVQNFATHKIARDKNLQFIEVASRGKFFELLFLHDKTKPKVNFRNNYGETALIEVLDGPYNEETLSKLEFLISVGAGPNVRGKSSKNDNTSPLGVAIWNSKAVFQSGNVEEVEVAQNILELLVAAGADVSGLEKNGRSLLHLAAEINNLFAAKLLLKSGVMVIAKDANDKTPFDIAASGEMIKLLKKYQGKKVS